MHKIMEKIFNEKDFLSQEEENELVKYSKTVSFRLKCLKEIEIKEKQIIQECVDFMMAKYPAMERYTHVKEKTYRDMTLVLRYCTQSMLRDNKQFLLDSVLTWFRTIIQSFGFDRGVIRETYTKMDELLKRDLDPKTYNFLQPYIKLTIDTLSEK